MPNWCDNTFTVGHADPAMVDRFEQAFKKGALLNEFIPVHPDLLSKTITRQDGEVVTVSVEPDSPLAISNIEKHGYKDWYDFRIQEWGIKWDLGCGECDSIGEITRDDQYTVSGWFTSAWCPPIAGFEHLAKIGFTVELRYNEPGMCFAGVFFGANGETSGADFEYDRMKEILSGDFDWKDSPSNVIDIISKYVKELVDDFGIEFAPEK